MFNQLAGINAIIYYAPRIFEMTGLGQGTALLSSAGIRAGQFHASPYWASTLSTGLGGASSCWWGSFGLIATLGLVARAFYLQEFGGMLVPVLLFVYIGSLCLLAGRGYLGVYQRDISLGGAGQRAGAGQPPRIG